MSVPVLEYTIKVNNVKVGLNSNTRVSDKDGANKLNIAFKTDQSLMYWEARCTKDESETYGIGYGRLLAQAYSVSGNETHSYDIEIDTTKFNQGDGIYRIGLYAKADSDGYWDITYLLLSTESDGSNLEFTGKDTTFEVLTNQPIPDGSTF